MSFFFKKVRTKFLFARFPPPSTYINWRHLTCIISEWFLTRAYTQTYIFFHHYYYFFFFSLTFTLSFFFFFAFPPSLFFSFFASPPIRQISSKFILTVKTDEILTYDRFHRFFIYPTSFVLFVFFGGGGRRKFIPNF